MHRTRRRAISFFGKNRDGHQRRLVVLVASPGPSYPAEVGALAGGACRIRRCVTRVKVSAQIWGCVCRKRRSLIPARQVRLMFRSHSAVYFYVLDKELQFMNWELQLTR